MDGSAAAPRAFWTVLSAALLIHGVALGGGYMHYEGQFFLAAYLDGRDLPHKLFSARYDEWGCYQGRELSFAFGWLDAQLVSLGARVGLPHLYSITTIAATFGTVFALWRLLPRLAPGIDEVQAGLLSLLFLATPAASLSGYYYRPAKALVAFFFILAISQSVSILRGETWKRPQLQWLALIASAAAMGWSDRQGVFLIPATIVVIAIVQWPLSERARQLIAALLAAFLFNTIWSKTAGPALAAWADGSMPDMRDERVSLRSTFGQLAHFGIALRLWATQLGFYFGNSGLVGAAIAVVASFIALIPRRRTAPEIPGSARVFLAVAVAAVMAVGLYAGMWVKLASLSNPDSARVYYWAPTTVTIAIVAALALSNAVTRWPSIRNPVSLVLGILLTTSVLSLPQHARIIAAGVERERVDEGPRVVECFSNVNRPIADSRLSPAGAQVCTRVRVAAFGTAGPGGSALPAQAMPVLYCRRSRYPQPAFRSLGP